MEKKSVVIVGGGFSGRQAYRMLSKEFNVTIIDNKDFFEFNPSMLRYLMDPTVNQHLLVPHPPFVEIDLVQRVVEPKEGKILVQCQSGKEFQCDYVMLSTGTGYNYPIKPTMTEKISREQRINMLDKDHSQLENAKRVVIVGGGVVGVELAAEIAYKYGQKKQIQIICSQNRLLTRFPQKAADYCLNWFNKNGVEVLFGERMKSQSTSTDGTGVTTVVTTSGKSIPADVVYLAIGAVATPNIVYSTPDSPNDTVRNGNFYQVNKYMQVSGSNHVFAAGDCQDSAEEKSAYCAALTAKLACDNMIAHAKGLALAQYPQAITYGASAVPLVEIISLGPKDGVQVIGALAMPGGAMKAVVEYLQILLQRERYVKFIEMFFSFMHLQASAFVYVTNRFFNRKEKKAV